MTKNGMEQRIRELEFEVNHDYMTNCYNRRYLDKVLKPKLTHSNVFISMIDINSLKSINDKFGHNGGDTIICDIAEELKEMGTVIRVGGDEFMLITENKPKFKSDLYSYGTIEKKLNQNIEFCINEADAKMYEMKKGKSYEQKSIE